MVCSQIPDRHDHNVTLINKKCNEICIQFGQMKGTIEKVLEDSKDFFIRNKFLIQWGESGLKDQRVRSERIITHDFK